MKGIIRSKLLATFDLRFAIRLLVYWVHRLIDQLTNRLIYQIKNQKSKIKNISCLVFYVLFMLSILMVPSEVVGNPTLRVLDAEGKEVASLEVLEAQEVKYVLVDEVSRLFNGTKKYEPLIKRMTVTMMGKQIIFTVGQRLLKVDGEEYVLSNPPVSISGRIAIPVEFLTEVFPAITGKQVTLDRKNWVLQIGLKSSVEQPNEVSDSTASGFRVIIDPGHGGYDTGARSKDGLLEKDLTLRIAQQMKKLVEEKDGIEVYLTRNVDNYITATERVNLANKLRGRVYLSIHFNSSPSQLSKGFCIYVNSNQMRLKTGFDLEADMFSRAKPATDGLSEVKRFLPQSKQLAKEIADRLESIGLTGERDKEVFLAAMDSLSMPGVLVEVLYLSNPQDLTTVSTPDFTDSVAQALCDSILVFKGAAR